MPFTELIRVTCDECPARLTGSNGRGPDAPGRYVEIYEGHSQAIDAAVRQGWYVDARQTLCPAHWPGEEDEDEGDVKDLLGSGEYWEGKTRYCTGCEELAKERDELLARLELRDSAAERARKMWQKQTGEENVWPDRSNLMVWLMERIAELKTSQQIANTSWIPVEERLPKEYPVEICGTADGQPWRDWAWFDGELNLDKIDICRARYWRQLPPLPEDKL